jgi:Uma2 family endonuclease
MAVSPPVFKPADDQLEPTWEIARLFPAQGTWSEEEYLALTHGTNHLIEFSHGNLEFLAMPTRTHQKIVFFLSQVLYAFLSARGLGTVLFAPLRVRLWAGKFREPDLVVMLAEHRDREHEAFFDGADLVIEVVSDDDPARDLVTKRREYAQAGIPEYWIVEPQVEMIIVLRLDQGQYIEYGRFGRGTNATSALLDDLTIDVTRMFDEATRQP